MFRIQELCRKRGVRQLDLANLLGMREDSLSTSIKRRSLSLDKLEKIAEALDVDISELFVSTKTKTDTALSCPNCGQEIAIELKKPDI